METLKQSETLNQLILFAEDSPASRFPLPGSEEAGKMTVTSGLKCSESFPRPGPLGLLQKMLLESSIWHSTKCVLTWKVKATKSRRLLFQLAPSMPRTEGIGSGLLLTPRATEIEESPEKFRDRMNSKRPNDRKDGYAHLTMQIAMLPTPISGDWKGQQRKEGNPDMLCGKIENPDGQKTGYRLSPAFVEWMQGYPEGWTELID